MKKPLVSIEPAAIKLLNPAEGVRLIRDLLWSEVTRLGIPRQNVVISSDITVKDGGIDASVETEGSYDSILVPGACHFQIKTGESFKPWQEAQIRAELFGASPVARANLGAAVLQCVESGTAYALVTLGHDLTTEQQAQASGFLRKFFEDCGFGDPQISVLGVTQIISLLTLHPSLCLDLNGLGDLPFQTSQSWADNSDMTKQLALGDSQESFIGELQAALDGADIQHVRIVGEPGIGKSRLVLEAILRHPDFLANTLYVRQASDFQNSPLFNELLKKGRNYSVLLVVDECDDADRSAIWRALKGRELIKLVTIDHGPEASGGQGMQTLQAPPLEAAQVEEILRSYIGDKVGLRNWAEWCGGSARVAHALGENLRDNPEDILRTPGTVPIWDRFISGYGQTRGDESGRVVLRHIALFEKFGARIPVQYEAEFIAKLVGKTDPSITQAKFDSIVGYYRKRRILQGDRTLRIVPPALQVYLWRDWWENYGSGVDLKEMMSNMPKSLYGWFMRPFVYAHGVESARDIVKAILDPRSGLFADREFLTSETGLAFISLLAEADPASTLALLKSTFSKWPDDELTELKKGRQNIAWALEKIAVWEGHFRQAAKVLLRLSLGDTSTNSNNAKGIFTALFSPNGAATEAPFVDRVSLAKEFLTSGDSFERSMGLLASAEVFSNRGNSRIIGVEYQGLRPEVKFWQAKVWSELIDPWRSMLGDLMQVRAQGDSAWRAEVDKALLSSIENLARTNVLHGEIIDAMNELSKVDDNFEELTQLVLRLLRYRNPEAPEDFTRALTALSTKLVGTTFSERLRRYVLSTIWEDDYPSDDDSDEPSKIASRIRLGLAQEAARDDILLADALPVLFKSKGYRVEQFGFDVAGALADYRFDDAVLTQTRLAQTPVYSMFLSGYLRGVHGMNPTRWEALAEQLISDPQRWILLAVVCSGMTEKIFDSVLGLYKSGAMDSDCLVVLGRNSTQSNVGVANIRRALSAMLERREEGFYRFAVEIAERKLCHSLPPHADDEALAFRILCDDCALAHSMNTMDEHYWHGLAKRFRAQFPNSDGELMGRLICASASFHGIAASGHVSKVAGEICAANPAQAWALVSQELLGERAHIMIRWLGEGGSHGRPVELAILNFRVEDIFEWIDTDPGHRSLMITETLVPSLEQGPAGDLTKAFLAKYGELEHVGGSVMSRFSMGSWSGPRSQHCKVKRDRARKWLTETDSSKVQDWLSAYIESLSQEIEHALISEERYF
ncbi:hypothetical protein [Glaciimonas immobilis]|uniref:Uncharacterized protein n=1 Tax=Glaciimonas immobilis TaxID=728004 RepID=A0A840RW81_9BURK|nr:hypothetical protein [Glaciimonas immobilis]KAF3998512.1 hypothetical protein HAV38_06530 [Glaciimonas immobilis]MBB5201358.1 hypothetical protein [Glaciimonas immobilis]